MAVTESTKALKYVTTCLHSTLLKLAYPEHSNNPKTLVKQNISEIERCLETIKEEDEVNEMVWPILEDLKAVAERSWDIRNGEDPEQSNLF